MILSLASLAVGMLIALVCPWSLQGQIHFGDLTVTRRLRIIKNTLLWHYYSSTFLPDTQALSNTPDFPIRLANEDSRPDQPFSKQHNSSGFGWWLVGERLPKSIPRKRSAGELGVRVDRSRHVR